jgi:hypothetical protein
MTRIAARYPLGACRRARRLHDPAMDRATAITQIREHCNTASASVTKIHPLLNALGDDGTKAEIVKALFEITKNVEVVKKQVMKLEKKDDSTLL